MVLFEFRDYFDGDHFALEGSGGCFFDEEEVVFVEETGDGGPVERGLAVVQGGA